MSKAAQNEARNIERAYQSPEIAHQRFRTLQALGIRPGEAVLDAGCGPGLLTAELAGLVGERGRVLAVDKSRVMLDLARQRCRGMSRVELRDGSIERIEEADASFDAVVCTQVLLYIADVPAVLAELHRLLKPGGRIAVVETDWRGCVLSSEDFSLTERLIEAWDAAVPSPNLPVRLAPMLRSTGFNALRIEPVPVLNTGLPPDSYSNNMTRWLSEKGVEQGRVGPAQAREWLDDLHRKAERGEYFFCVNRFVFSAVK